MNLQQSIDNQDKNNEKVDLMSDFGDQDCYAQPLFRDKADNNMGGLGLQKFSLMNVRPFDQLLDADSSDN